MATLFILISVLACVLLDLLVYADKPESTVSIERVVIVPAGYGFEAVSERLHQAGIIQNQVKFKLLARLRGYDKKIKAGEYLFPAALPPAKILEIMVNGKARLHKLTVPEGYNLCQIATIISKAGFKEANDFLNLATDFSFVHEQGIDADTFEGYLFPDTYYFPKNVTSKDIISIMIRRFRSLFVPAWQEHSRDLGFSVHQVVTLASLIEKETGASFERTIISSVFHNRLKRKMRLESDPTVIYGIKNFDGNIKRKHLAAETPYNTYVQKGLPYGPIANPGIKSIEAALYPAGTDFLYFVSKKDGTHEFSTNIRDHNRAVIKYQLR